MINNLKTRFIIAIAVFLSASLVFTSCGNPDVSSNDSGTSQKNESTADNPVNSDDLPKENVDGQELSEEQLKEIEESFEALEKPSYVAGTLIGNYSEKEIVEIMKSPDYSKRIDALKALYCENGAEFEKEGNEDGQYGTYTGDFEFDDNAEWKTGLEVNSDLWDLFNEALAAESEQDGEVSSTEINSDDTESDDTNITEGDSDFSFMNKVSGATLLTQYDADGDYMYSYMGTEDQAKDIVKLLKDNGFSKNPDEMSADGMYIFSADRGKTEVTLTCGHGVISVIFSVK